LAQAVGTPILGRLPFDPRLADCAERGVLFLREHPDAPLTKQFATMATNLEQAIARRAAAKAEPQPLATEDPA